MDLKLWAPFMDIDKEWRFDFPRVVREAASFRPSMDVTKTDGKLVLTAELPGISPDEVHVSLTDDILTIQGEQNEEREVSPRGTAICTSGPTGRSSVESPYPTA